MANSEIDAQSFSFNNKDEYEEIDRELYIVPLDIYDGSEGSIKQTGNTSFEVSISTDVVKEEKKYPILDKIHGVLDIAGFIPALGVVPDVVNGFIYLCQGDFANMGLSFVAAVPGYGDAIAGVTKGAKYAGKGLNIIKQSKVVSANIKRIENFDIDKQAEYIVYMAKQNDIKQISLLWTNGTKFNTKAVVRKVKQINPKLEIKAFETTVEGIQMEKAVNRKLVEEGLRRGYSKERLFKLLKEDRLWKNFAEKGNIKLKKELQVYQRTESEKYAKKIMNDYIIEFKRTGLDYGQANKAELEMLKKNGKYIDEEWNISKETDVLTRYRNPETGSTKIIDYQEKQSMYSKKHIR